MYDQPKSQEKHNLSGTVPFPNAVRRTKSRITADTDVIDDLCTEGNIERSSDPDPSQPQQSPSAGSEATAVNKDSLSKSMPDTVQTTCETANFLITKFAPNPEARKRHLQWFTVSTPYLGD